MKQLSELAKLAKELEKQTTACKRCGICQAACPLFPHTGLERDIARGKIAVLEGVMTETVKDAPRVLQVLDRCLLCGRCAAVCPTGVDTLQIFFTARALLAGYLGLSPLKKLIFRKILARPRLFDHIAGLAARMQPLFFRSAGSGSAVYSPRTSTALLFSRRHLAPPAPISFRRRRKQQKTEEFPGASPETTVLFYTGCLIDKMFPHVGQAAANALEYHRARVLLPENEFCCGIPALAAGDKTAFRRLVAANLEALNPLKFDWLVTACATCAFTIKILWPQILDKTDEKHEAVTRLSEKTIDITEFIAQNPPKTPPVKSPSPIPVTYHDPCHLKTSLGVSQAPRRLLECTRDYQLVEMAGADACCGMGGSFGLTHSDLSRRIGEKKAAAIRATGCQIVATACPACMMQLMDALAESGETDIPVRHVIELYMADK